MGKSLKQYTEEIASIVIDDSLSDDAVAALTNIHLSVMTMIAANLLEDEYGSVRSHREAMEKLFAICRKRSAGNQSILRRSRIIPTMYAILDMPDTVFDYRKQNMCFSRLCRLADQWHSKTKNADSTTEKERIAEYGLLDGIIREFRYADDADKMADSDYLFLKRRISEWCSEINDDGCWAGLPDYEAARRIDIMTGYSNSNNDSSFDSHIETARRFYSAKVLSDKYCDGHTLFYLYWAMMQGVDRLGGHNADLIAEYAARMCESHPRSSKEWLWYAAVIIDRYCDKVNSNIKRQLLAYSA